MLRSCYSVRTRSSALAKSLYQKQASGWWSTRSYASLKKDDEDINHRYSKTLSLPETTFPSRSSPELNSEYLHTSTEELYQYQSSKSPKAFKNEELFVLHDGPPYANGDLHLGHSINKVLKDIVNRSRLLNNKQQVMYIPGFDCHGLPIELKALNSLKEQDPTKKSKKKSKKNKNVDEDLTTQLSAVEVRKMAKSHALKTIVKQTEAFKKFGVMGEWEKPYRTLDKHFELNQLKIFKKMIAQNMIKRQKKPVYWGCETGTALAEGELEYNDKHRSTTAYLKFPIIEVNTELSQLLKEHNINPSNISALIWTSTPWTIAANKAICVNEKFDYTLLYSKESGEYLLVLQDLQESILSLKPEIAQEFQKTDIIIPGSSLSKTFYENPAIKNKEINRFPIIHGTHVTNTAGTGLVHTAPGHGQDDYLVGLNHNIEIYSPVDDKGRYTSELLPGFEELAGLKVLKDGTSKMLELLKNSGMVLDINYNYIHSYPYDWRSKKPIVIRATPQWFTDLSSIKNDAMKAIDKVKFHPERGYNRLSSFINTRNEWCISRQRFWGVPIPVFYHKETNAPLITEESIDYAIQKIGEFGTDAWFEEEESVERWLPESYKSQGAQYQKGTDTIDVWFDSGSSWTIIEEILQEKNILANRKFVADIYLEGSDQHRGWFQSSLLTKMAAKTIISSNENKEIASNAPYSTIITHGFTLDAKGQKMSKSIGNTIDPIAVINGDNKQQIPKIGVDGLRLWIASSDYTSDLSLSPVILKHVADNLKKIRITFRYLLGNLETKNDSVLTMFSNPQDFECDLQKLSNIDKYILGKLHSLIKNVDSYNSTFQYNRIIQELNYFMNIELSATYFNIIKDKLYADDHSRSQSVKSIKFVLYEVLKGYLYILSPILPVITQEVWSHVPKVLFSDVMSPLVHNYDFSNLEKLAASKEGQSVEKLFEKVWQLRDGVQKVIEVGRKQDKLIKNSLETNLIIDSKYIKDLIAEASCSEEELADILLVSEVRFEQFSKDQNEAKKEGNYAYFQNIPVGQTSVDVKIVNASKFKCPRCWKFTSKVKEELCGRCDDAVHQH
ncbi:isoleucine--tRNA ligase [Saccharomycopsis crataegensis]|uniref:isoleucine--tRNA ligase n=1 Tax=Saccharomycopsis crataegensis TaxID=43959 RepID=A0AAV5QK25_9ASCO|nr:isoleucine--tRNA ligase [Saccharomycopsis crataegensis]